jgi:hypothetical protein
MTHQDNRTIGLRVIAAMILVAALTIGYVLWTQPIRRLRDMPKDDAPASSAIP